MSQRQPHGADLVVAGRLGVEDAARDIEVGFGIAIVQQPALRVRDEYSRKTQRSQAGGYGRER